MAHNEEIKEQVGQLDVGWKWVKLDEPIRKMFNPTLWKELEFVVPTA